MRALRTGFAVALPVAVIAMALLLMPAVDPPFSAAIVAGQRTLQQSLTAALRAVQQTGWAGAGPLALAGFLYGVLHAAGPGHGKAVVSAYALAETRLLRRAVALAFAASMVQALTAIALVTGALFVFETTARGAEAAALWLERASFAAIAAFGAVMAVRAALRVRLAAASSAAAGHEHGHHHDHHHGHAHGPDCGCGHSHMPPPQAAEGSWRGAAAAILAVGLRPCSGAILALVFSRALGIYPAGIAAALAMGLGTAVTVSALAVLAAGLRRGALAAAGGRRAALAGALLSFLGWTLMLLLGLALLTAPPPAPVGGLLR
ncbi:nickel/cobalt transporter [Arenibaculum pallidiluteum]|uniref:nickel/cobalt transporter n=1 Tax=Arenibaculum pallidiluteum TaxID=2812559 RepID=UPI001A96F9BE|nr:high frequency lysogenization protein HflD [Arenibaculum pallidiluteum]